MDESSLSRMLIGTRMFIAAMGHVTNKSVASMQHLSGPACGETAATRLSIADLIWHNGPGHARVIRARWVRRETYADKMQRHRQGTARLAR